MPVSKKNQNLPKLWQYIKPQQSVRQFENFIIQFHNAHRTSIRQLPYVLGKKINLRKLYIGVIKRGGYKKVNENNEWDEVLGDLNLPRETTNCELAIQSIYHRYLEEYEREQWNALSSGAYADSFNNNNDNNSMDIDLSKHSSYISELALRDKSFMASFVNENTPKVFCDYQHIVHSSVRTQSGMSCNVKEMNEFNHLKMSLLSGLSNEIEFALNTLLIMSNSNQIRLDLRFTGNLLDLMLATVGVFEPDPCSYYEQFKNCSWMTDCLQFWNTTVEDGIGRIFLIPNIFNIPKSEIKNLLKNNIISSNPDSSCLFNNDNNYHQITDPCAQRIHLVATVLYNLTTDYLSNSRSIINNFQFLRFIFLSVHSTDPVLRRLCLQTLSRLRFVLYPIANSSSLHKSLLCSANGMSVDLDSGTQDVNEDDDSEEEWFSQFLLDFVQSMLSSENRSVRISALEMVQTLCLIEENQQTLNKSLQTSFVTTITSQLLVPDIHPLCCALESLVSLSQLGEDMCRRMAMCQALLKILLQFIQIEAQMFGPSAVYKIKTFNHRPPIPMPTYHSLPQIMRFPSNSPVRQPFANPLSSTSLTNPIDPNIQIQCSNIALPVSVANYNSISTHGLSKMPLQNPIKSSQVLHQSYGVSVNNPNNTISSLQPLQKQQPIRTSQLTPLQQIDQLLTKSIASFENPSSLKKDEFVNSEDRSKLDMMREKEPNSLKLFINTDSKSKDDMKAIKEKRVVKIKCGIDGPDCEIGEINGCNNKGDKEINGLKFEAPLSNVQSPHIVNGDEIDLSRSFNGERKSSTISQDKIMESNNLTMDKHQVYMNGSLEIDASNFDDPDRRQMPPPSLPTPSMLKKQMRPKLSPPSQVGVANGYLQQLNSKVKRKLVSEMTLTTNAQIEDRCDRAKAWLRRHYRLSEDSKMFVLKQDLVNELHKFMFEDDDDDSQAHGSRRIFSAHELHSCIKDVFGNKVQVKVEHRVNGKSQLTYSNLCRILEQDNDRTTPPNGIINPIIEMNGFVHNSTNKKRQKLNHNLQDNPVKVGEQKPSSKRSAEKSGIKQENKPELPKQRIKQTHHYRKRVHRVISKAKRKLMLSCNSTFEKSLKMQSEHSKPQIHANDTMSYGTSFTSTSSSLSVIESQLLSGKINGDNVSTEIHLSILCLWGSCMERFVDENSLNLHLINDHIPLSVANNMSPVRTNCQWQHCLTALIPRAPLSLLSHVIQEHCNRSHLSAFPSHTINQRLGNPPISYNVTSPPVINQSISSNQLSQISEKSGWSVLYDHFRLDEQMQPHLPEGPITKHIRISSSIILRNMSRHSIVTKEFLKNNENLLSVVAMSNQDCAPIIVQCLDELKLANINDS